MRASPLVTSHTFIFFGLWEETNWALSGYLAICLEAEDA